MTARTSRKSDSGAGSSEETGHDRGSKGLWDVEESGVRVGRDVRLELEGAGEGSGSRSQTVASTTSVGRI